VIVSHALSGACALTEIIQMADSRALLGRPVARNINEATSDKSIAFAAKAGRRPKLAVLASSDPSSQSYLKTIRSTAKNVNCDTLEIPVESAWDLGTVIKALDSLNKDESVDGILVQEPLPSKINLDRIGIVIDPRKDIDGISPEQSGRLFRNHKSAMAPPTARACIEILDFYRYGLQGLEVVVLGRSLVVGKPAGILALSRNATVTWCHSKTHALPAICKRAEILIVAVGRARMVDETFIRPGATVIDVGINIDENGKLCGDVDSDRIRSIATAYTPVPGGIGPVTTACLFDNLVRAAGYRIKI